MPRPKSRRAITLIELLVVITVIGILIALILPAVQAAREAARRTECANHLKQLGLALHNHNDVLKSFPNDEHERYRGSPGTFYVAILPFIEQQPQAQAYKLARANNTRFDPRPVSIFLCPSRRNASVGPRDDYGAGAHPCFFTHEANLASWRSILGGSMDCNPGFGHGLRGQFHGVSLEIVTNRDGSSNTLLLMHKGLRPSFYEGGSPIYNHAVTDDNWALLADPGLHGNAWWEHKRSPGATFPDSNRLISWRGNRFRSESVMGSPHAVSMPSLFADGHVRDVRYLVESGLMMRLWAWNDGGANGDF